MQRRGGVHTVESAVADANFDAGGAGQRHQQQQPHRQPGVAPSGVRWMDLHAKKRGSDRGDQNLLIQHGPVDVSDLKATLQANPEFCRDTNQADNAKLTGR